MQYWGGNGVEDDLHSSLAVYIDCFESPPFPRMYPRGGGVWDQDPILMRDFRTIRTFAVKWKDAQRQLGHDVPEAPDEEVDQNDPEALLNAWLDDMGETGTY